MMPSIGAQAIASLPTDRETQKRSLAGAIFPGSNYDDVKNRLFEDNGRMGYVDLDGSKYYAEPAFKLPTSGANIDETAKWIASKTGPAMGFAGGIAGGSLGGLPGGIAGAAAGESARQGLAYKYANEDKPWDQRIGQSADAAINKGITGAVPGYLKRLGYKLPF